MSGRPATAARARTAPLRDALRGAGAALALLTVFPARSRGSDLRAAAAWFPLVGALVGGLAGAVRYTTEPLLGATVASVLAATALVAVTGALHQDGLADCADSLGARGGREAKLAVMRDPATGVFGTLALVGWALLLVTALAQLSGPEALRALVVAAVVGRTAALVHALATEPARGDGLGASFSAPTAALAVAGAATIAVCLLLEGVLHGGLAAAIGVAVACATAAWARAALGGRTGDTLGATVALAEVAVCVAIVAATG